MSKNGPCSSRNSRHGDNATVPCFQLQAACAMLAVHPVPHLFDPFIQQWSLRSSGNPMSREGPAATTGPRSGTGVPISSGEENPVGRTSWASRHEAWHRSWRNATLPRWLPDWVRLGLGGPQTRLTRPVAHHRACLVISRARPLDGREKQRWDVWSIAPIGRLDIRNWRSRCDARDVGPLGLDARRSYSTGSGDHKAWYWGEGWRFGENVWPIPPLKARRVNTKNQGEKIAEYSWVEPRPTWSERAGKGLHFRLSPGPSGGGLVIPTFLATGVYKCNPKKEDLERSRHLYEEAMATAAKDVSPGFGALLAIESLTSVGYR